MNINLTTLNNRLKLGLISILSAIAFGTQAEQTVNLQVTGIDNPELSNNVRIFLSTIDNDEADGSEYYQATVKDSISKALRALGYYDSQVAFRLQPRKAPLKDLLIAEVVVGKPVHLVEADVQIHGAAAQDEEFEKLQQTLPKAGTVLNHESYEDYKSSLQKLASTRGYFDAEFERHQLEVMPSTYQAWWRILFNSGDRYRYGKIKFENAQIEESYLRNMLNIKTGDEYLLSDLSKLTSDYSSSNWFSSVLLQPHLQEKDKLVDLDVILYPRKKNSMELGIGYASDVGPRLQVGWKRPWINSRGHSFSTNLYVSAPKQTLEATYKMPLQENPLNYYYEYSAGVENEKDNDTKSLAATMAALRYWNHPTGWQYSLGVRSRYDSFTQADVKNKTLLLYPTASISRTRMRGGMFPVWGDAQRITFDLGRKLWLSDVDFFSVRASTSWIRTYADNHRFFSRLELGWLNTKDLQRLPPALRFFAGGDRSVRGYGYKKISPKDENGKAIGGSRLASGTLEYQYQVYPSWWLASFADAGLAANSFSTKELRYGAGMGVRWASPVGAVRFDIATPIRDKDNSKNIQFYIGLGTEL